MPRRLANPERDEAAPPEAAPLAVRDRRSRDKRELILDAAIKVFARAGYHGARVSDIAREAGIAYGLVYHYFKNKDEILATIFEEQWLGFIAAVEDIGAGNGTLRDRMVSVAALMLNAYRVRPDWVKVLVFEIQRSSRFAQPGQLRAVNQLFDAVRKILEDAQGTGELRDDVDAGVASTLFIGALELMITSLVLGVSDVPDDEPGQRAYYLDFANTTVEIFLNGCRANDVGGGAR
jgi:TetR/AcrR family fatty acid metabolism transcriptional regulator